MTANEPRFYHPPVSLLADRTAVVTGGGDIGSAIALALSDHGATVTVWDREKDVIADLPPGIEGAVVDVTSNRDIAGALDAVVAAAGGLDIQVNSAGVVSAVDVAEMSDEAWQQTIDVNLTGVFRCCRAVAPHMVERGSGSIVNISSLSGLRGSALFAHYCASKYGVIGLSESLAREVGHAGVRVNAVCPGAVDSEMNTDMLGAMARSSGTSYEEIEREIVERTALRRLVDPTDVAGAVVFLASDLASCVTGIALPVDGGLS